MTKRRRTTTVSTKGQVILPKEIRARMGWGPGTRLVVEETDKGLLLEPASGFAPTRDDEVFASLRYSGKAKTVDEVSSAIELEVRKRHARGRY